LNITYVRLYLARVEIQYTELNDPPGTSPDTSSAMSSYVENWAEGEILLLDFAWYKAYVPFLVPFLNIPSWT
jgi:hypothetical protein